MTFILSSHKDIYNKVHDAISDWSYFNTVKNDLSYFFRKKDGLEKLFKNIYCCQFSIFIYTYYANESPIDLQLPDCVQWKYVNNYLQYNNWYLYSGPVVHFKITIVIYHQSQEPSSQPSLHLWFTNLQSNSAFPSFLFTSLWILHSHWLNFSCEPVSGGECFNCSCKSSAHMLQG